MTTLYYGMIEEICVMLVDNDKEFVTKTTDLLKSYDYKVTTVDTTSAAMSVLSKGKQKTDVMILNAHSTNLLSFDLLAQAMTLNIISLVICDEFNELVAKKTLENGGHLYLKQSFEKEIVKHLWQFVLREKMRSEKEREGLGENRDQMKTDDIDNNNIVGGDEESGEKNNESSNNIHEAANDIVLNGRYKPRGKRSRKRMKEINEGESRRKNYIEWTEDLHAKFMNVVHQLGEGRCYPKDIHELMNSPGLTRMQVASHLQKCRRNNWRSPKERKNIRHRSSSVSHDPRSNFRKFGTMPRLQANVLNQQHNPDQIQRDTEFPFPTLNINNIFVEGESSVQQLYRPQLQVQPHYLGIDNPFNSSFLSTQPNVGAGLQQHGPLFDLNAVQGATYPGSRILSGTYIGNATINDYNSNVNMDNMTIYSSSAMMSDSYAGNVTINGLGVTNANANIHQYVGEPNMSYPRTSVVASCENYVEGNDSNEKETYNVDYLFQNLGPSSANLPNEQENEFDQGYADDQALGRDNEQPIFRNRKSF